MKYNDLLNFKPIVEIVKFSRTNEIDYQKSLIESFVFSDTFKKHLIPLMVRNIDYNNTEESFGLQVIGNYGTGKSHLMSLISIVAENEKMLHLVNESTAKSELEKIAGKFKVLRFELGNTESLWEIITFKLENYLEELGVDFSFDGHGPKSYFDKILLMMSEFEEKFADKGLLLVIDEMLAYLKGRSTQELNQDLAVLQALGQACDQTKFKFIFGVQEMIYHSPDFQFAAEMLQKVNDRYKDITITKNDVAFIVKNRILQKNEHQKQEIRKHLNPYLKYFKDMNNRIEDYIDLFPVHPTYFENFEKIRIGKSQREVLKTLSSQFLQISNDELPLDNPGLLTYDRYWQDLKDSIDLMADPDIRKVREITDTIVDKIEGNFIGVRASKIDVAKRITNACAIKILQNDLPKQNGTNTEQLVDDLCLTDNLASDREFLLDIIDTAAKQIITATSGQYFDENKDNGEFHLRIEGGINFDQKIKDYARTMSDSQKDEYFFKFLELNLPLDFDTYRTGFRIWAHTIDWKSHKTYRDGYIFFGNPNEKSTTQPRQHFYMYFMPIFDNDKKIRNHDEDEVYFIFEDLSKEFKDAVTLYGAAFSLQGQADTSQKNIYREKIDQLNIKARNLFNAEYTEITKVDYQGNELPLKGYPLLGAGASKEQIFSSVASQVFEPWFNDERQNYPKFTQLNTPITRDNYERFVKQALSKVANPEQANRDGEGLLAGLGLWVPGMLDYSHSPYAKSLLKLLNDKGEGQVLNRDEIIEFVDNSENLWLTRDFKIEAGLQFVVMAVLAALGEIEITLPSGKFINSTKLNDLKDIQPQDYYSFTHIKAPKGLNMAALKSMFVGLLGRDLSNHLKDPSTYTKLVTAATEWATKTVTILSKIKNGYTVKGIDVISPQKGSDYNQHFTAFAGLCDKLANYTSEAKIRNFSFSVEELNRLLGYKTEVEQVEKQLTQIALLDESISYLQQAKQYITDETLKNTISEATDQVGTIIQSNSDAEIAKYKNTLDSLKEDYASWYLENYLKYRISENDHTQLQALLGSDEYAIAEILKDSDVLSSAQLLEWQQKRSKLKVADSKVNKALILTAPYQEFNPVDYINTDIRNVKELKEELNNIVSDWENALLDTLEDPMVKMKIDLLDLVTQKLLENFKNKNISLAKDNVMLIRNAIMELHNGLEKVEFGFEDMKKNFYKPLTPDEAIEAFKKYIDQVSKGKERDKIRIILK